MFRRLYEAYNLGVKKKRLEENLFWFILPSIVSPDQYNQWFEENSDIIGRSWKMDKLEYYLYRKGKKRENLKILRDGRGIEPLPV